jgi:hypothetical protein
MRRGGVRLREFILKYKILFWKNIMVGLRMGILRGYKRKWRNRMGKDMKWKRLKKRGNIC